MTPEGVYKIGYDWTWPTIDTVLAPYHHGNNTPAVQGGAGSGRPFGPTLLYSAEPELGVLFEIMKNGHVSSVTLY